MAVSRNTSNDESSEWCTVHDIQTVATRPEDDLPVSGSAPLTWSTVRSANLPSLQQVENDPTAQRFRAGNIEIISTGIREENVSRPVITIDLNIRRRARRIVQQERREDAEDIMEGVGVDVDNSEDGANAEEVEVDGQNFVSANRLSTLDLLDSFRNRDREEASNSNETEEPSAAGEEGEEREAEAGPSNAVRNRGSGGSGSYLIIGPGSRARARLLYFGSPGAHRSPPELKLSSVTPILLSF